MHRDYIHIDDLAQAHLLALERLFKGLPGGQYNLGNGNGYTVMEVIEVAEKISKKPIPFQIAARRQGDPAILISSSENAMNELAWKPRFPDLETIIETAWNWHRKNPKGYRF